MRNVPEKWFISQGIKMKPIVHMLGAMLSSLLTPRSNKGHSNEFVSKHFWLPSHLTVALLNSDQYFRLFWSRQYATQLFTIFCVGRLFYQLDSIH
jgi:hypothetical protein